MSLSLHQIAWKKIFFNCKGWFIHAWKVFETISIVAKSSTILFVIPMLNKENLVQHQHNLFSFIHSLLSELTQMYNFIYMYTERHFKVVSLTFVHRPYVLSYTHTKSNFVRENQSNQELWQLLCIFFIWFRHNYGNPQLRPTQTECTFSVNEK